MKQPIIGNDKNLQHTLGLLGPRDAIGNVALKFSQMACSFKQERNLVHYST